MEGFSHSQEAVHEVPLVALVAADLEAAVALAEVEVQAEDGKAAFVYFEIF